MLFALILAVFMAAVSLLVGYVRQEIRLDVELGRGPATTSFDLVLFEDEICLRDKRSRTERARRAKARRASRPLPRVEKPWETARRFRALGWASRFRELPRNQRGGLALPGWAKSRQEVLNFLVLGDGEVLSAGPSRRQRRKARHTSIVRGEKSLLAKRLWVLEEDEIEFRRASAKLDLVLNIASQEIELMLGLLDEATKPLDIERHYRASEDLLREDLSEVERRETRRAARRQKRFEQKHARIAERTERNKAASRGGRKFRSVELRDRKKSRKTRLARLERRVENFEARAEARASKVKATVDERWFSTEAGRRELASKNRRHRRRWRAEQAAAREIASLTTGFSQPGSSVLTREDLIGQGLIKPCPMVPNPDQADTDDELLSLPAIRKAEQAHFEWAYEKAFDSMMARGITPSVMDGHDNDSDAVDLGALAPRLTKRQRSRGFFFTDPSNRQGRVIQEVI